MAANIEPANDVGYIDISPYATFPNKKKIYHHPNSLNKKYTYFYVRIYAVKEGCLSLHITADSRFIRSRLRALPEWFVLFISVLLKNI